MATPISSQLQQAWQRSELTHEQLRQRAGLKCTADSLCRKLSGKQILTTTEAELLAQALDYEIAWSPKRRARRAA